MRIRGFFLALALSLIVLTAGSVPAMASAFTDAPGPCQETTQSAKPTTGKWIQKDGKYYWKWSDGTIITRSGWQKLNGNTYYLGKGGARVTGWKTIDGKKYYFRRYGVLYTERGFQTIQKNTYYFYKDHSVARGLTKIGTKKYYFSSGGVLKTNLRPTTIDGNYYIVDAKGVATRITVNEAKCIVAAQKYIAKHASTEKTTSGKLRRSFRYLLGNMKYNPGYYRWSGDKKYFENKDGLYRLALETFNSPVLRGNCHRFAACFAACAKELGYKAYVVTTTGDHSFVMINGLYYDNMGAKYGSRTHSSYNVYKKQLM